jgi:alpha-tubulin suppressor-like RCC1 family protein
MAQRRSKLQRKNMKTMWATGLLIGLTIATAIGQGLTIDKSQYQFDHEDGSAYYFVPVAVVLPSNLYAWGSGSVTNFPTDVTNAVQVSSGNAHCTALLADGSVVAWGDNTYGQTNYPALSNACVVASGSTFSAVVLTNGSIVTWGDFPFDVSGVTDAYYATASCATSKTNLLVMHNDGQVSIIGTDTMPFAITNAIGIASFGGRYMALKDTGALVLWGGSYTNISPWATNITALAVGTSQNAVLRSDGTALTWAATVQQNGTVRTGSNIVASVYGTSLLGLKSDGSLVKYSGSFNVPSTNAPLSTFSTGNGFGVGILAQ